MVGCGKQTKFNCRFPQQQCKTINVFADYIMHSGLWRYGA